MKTHSIRLDKQEEEILDKLIEEGEIDKSAITRKLLKEGYTYRIIKKYAQNEITMGKAAEMLNISIGEFMIALEKLKIPLNITIEDYKQGLKILQKVD